MFKFLRKLFRLNQKPIHCKVHKTNQIAYNIYNDKDVVTLRINNKSYYHDVNDIEYQWTFTHINDMSGGYTIVEIYTNLKRIAMTTCSNSESPIDCAKRQIKTLKET